MKRILLCTALLFILGLVSCNKDQRQITKLDGKWNVVSAEIEGYGESNPDILYEFEYCKLKTSDYCDVSIHNFETNEVISGIYSVTDRGNKLILTTADGFGYSYREYKILKLSNRRLRLENTNANNGELSLLELKFVKN